MKNKPFKYEIYVEGELNTTVATVKQADKLAREYRAEGWNVKIVSVFQTLVGEMGISI